MSKEMLDQLVAELINKKVACDKIRLFYFLNCDYIKNDCEHIFAYLSHSLTKNPLTIL